MAETGRQLSAKERYVCEKLFAIYSERSPRTHLNIFIAIYGMKVNFKLAFEV